MTLQQALDKLRGKNGDVKITAKDGFCMQKLLGGYDQDINWCLDWLWQIWSNHCDYTLWCCWQIMTVPKKSHPHGIEKDTQNISEYSLQFFTVIYLITASVCFGAMGASILDDWLQKCQQVLDFDFWQTLLLFSLPKMDCLSTSLSVNYFFLQSIQQHHIKIWYSL